MHFIMHQGIKSCTCVLFDAQGIKRVKLSPVLLNFAIFFKAHAVVECLT